MQFTVFRILFFSTSRINYCDVSRTTNINLMQSLVGLLFLPIAGAIHYQLKKTIRMIDEIVVCGRSIDHRGSCIENFYMIIFKT